MALQEFKFTLILSGMAELSPGVLDALYESGCDDALVGMRDGIAFADFVRSAASFRAAILSAIRDVENAAIGAKVEHVEPDEMVTMSEIARRLNYSREGIRQWVAGARGPGSFPAPAGNLKQRSPLWRWTEVLQWHQSRPLSKGKPARKAQSDRKAGGDMAAINAALDLRRHMALDDAMELLESIAFKTKRKPKQSVGR